ncbi:MAG: hypothetical protein WC542_04405 [Paludibacter sp.]
MRTALILLFFAGVLGASHVSAQNKQRFFLYCTASGDSSARYAEEFEEIMSSNLTKSFPCVRVRTQKFIRERLNEEKIKQLKGLSEDTPSFCDDLACDYFINLELSDFLSDQIVASASCILYRKVEPLVRYAKNAPRNPASIRNIMNTVAETLIKKLGKYEICPFTGPVSITINSTIDTTHTEQYGVYCNGSDQQYRKEMTIKNQTLSDWKLERKGIPRTDGTMTFYTNEESKVTEENGCFKCKSGREGGRTYTEIRSMKVKGNGISHESIRDGKPQDDTRIELRFMDNGTYYVTTKGTSQPVTGEEKVVTSAEGTCDNLPQETKVVPKDIKIPLKEIFGPYPGKSTDKVLTQKDSKETYNSTIKEKTTITIDFTLTQKDK